MKTAEPLVGKEEAQTKLNQTKLAITNKRRTLRNTKKQHWNIIKKQIRSNLMNF
jgi:hypothetical protein